MNRNFLVNRYLLFFSFFFCSNYGYAQFIDTLEAKLEVAYQQEDSIAIINLRSLIKQYYLDQEDWESCMINYCETGYDYWNLGNKAKMEIYLDSALLFAQSKEIDTLSLGYSYLWNYYGWYYNENIAFQKAIEVYKKGVDLEIRNNNDSIEIARAYQNLSTQFDNLGDYQQSIYFYEFALLYLPQDDLLLAQILNNLGIAYQNINERERAISCYQQSLDIITRLNLEKEDRDLVLSVYNNLATVYNDLDLFSEAYLYMDKIKQLINRNDAIELADYHQILGGIYLHQGNLPKSEEHLTSALTLRKQELSKRHPHTAISYRELGELFFRKKKYQEALNYYQQAIFGVVSKFKDTSNIEVNPNLKDNILDHVALLKILHLKGQALVQSNRLEDAQKTYLQAIEIADFLRINYQTEKSKFHILGRNIIIYEEAIQLALNTKDTPLAFQLTERSKATLLIENIKSIEAKEFLGLPDTLLEKERILKTQIAQHQLKYSVNYPTIPEVQQKLIGEKTALIEYFMGDSTIFVFGVTADELYTHTIPRTIGLALQINQLRESLDTLAFDQTTYHNFTTAAFEVYQLLLHPILKKIGHTKQELIIIPDGLLGYIPFQALIQQQVDLAHFEETRFDTLAYILKDYAINYAYSSTLLVAQSADNKNTSTKKTPSIDFGGFAPIFENGTTASSSRKLLLQKLKFSQKEITAINEFLGGKMFLGQAASTEQFKQEVDQFKIVHLSTHAEAGATAMDTKIHFLDDYLTVKDIYNTPISADLTVLSACETGIGKLPGCPSMVTSLWQVDDNKTAKLMVDFYKNLKKGMSKPVALQQAQITYLDTLTSLEAAHPFYWAAFIQTGASKPIFSSGLPWMKILLGLSVCLLLLVGLFRKNIQ